MRRGCFSSDREEEVERGIRLISDWAESISAAGVYLRCAHVPLAKSCTMSVKAVDDNGNEIADRTWQIAWSKEGVQDALMHGKSYTFVSLKPPDGPALGEYF